MKHKKPSAQPQRARDEEAERRAAQAYAEAIRARREEEFKHGLPLARLLELDIPKKSEQRRIGRILETEERARRTLEAIRRKACE
jgi:hypothetical protein